MTTNLRPDDQLSPSKDNNNIICNMLGSNNNNNNNSHRNKNNNSSSSNENDDDNENNVEAIRKRKRCATNYSQKNMQDEVTEFDENEEEEEDSMNDDDDCEVDCSSLPKIQSTRLTPRKKQQRLRYSISSSAAQKVKPVQRCSSRKKLRSRTIDSAAEEESPDYDYHVEASSDEHNENEAENNVETEVDAEIKNVAMVTSDSVRDTNVEAIYNGDIEIAAKLDVQKSCDHHQEVKKAITTPNHRGDDDDDECREPPASKHLTKTYDECSTVSHTQLIDENHHYAFKERLALAENNENAVNTPTAAVTAESSGNCDNDRDEQEMPPTVAATIERLDNAPTTQYTEQYISTPNEQALVTNVEMLTTNFNGCMNNKRYEVYDENSTATAISSIKPTITLTDIKADGCAPYPNDRQNTTPHTTVAQESTLPISDILLTERSFQCETEAKQTNLANNNTNSSGNCGIWMPHGDSKREEQQQHLNENTEHVLAKSLEKQQQQQPTTTTIAHMEQGICLQANSSESVLEPRVQQHREQHQQLSDSYRLQQQQQHEQQMLAHMQQQQQQQTQQNYAHQHTQQQHADVYAQMLQQQSHYTHYTQHTQQQQYAHEQLFGLHQHQQQQHQHQHQQQHHHNSHIAIQHLTLQNHMQIQQTLQQQQQQQAQHQMQEVYQDLLIDEFPEDPNYKLGLSPSNVKHENQDDGYETSAGDVLTPNSHSSSTHSLTPQHQMQHVAVGILPQIKTEENQQLHQHQQVANSKQLRMAQQQQMPQLNELQLNGGNCHNTEMPTVTSPNMTNDPYCFIEDDMRMMSSPTARMSNVGGDPAFLSVTDVRQNNSDVFAMKHQLSSLHDANNQQLTQQTHLAQNLADQHDHLQVSNDIEQQQQQQQNQQHVAVDLNLKPPQKRRGRKKKILVADHELMQTNMNPHNPTDRCDDVSSTAAAVASLLKVKERKKHDRFNGMSEEEVIKRTLPDHLCDNLDIVIVGINPGLFAAYKGHHYAGPGNHFWKCLYLSGLTQEQMNADEDYKLIKYGIGFTNMVERATKGSADLTRKEIKEGSRILLEKLQRFRPKIAVFNGKLIFEVFSGKKDFNFGRQPECVDGTDTYIWVMPSSSARCAQLPRAADKVPFYAALKKFRDYLKGLIPHIDEAECIFTEQRIKQCCDQENLKNLTSVEHSEQTSLIYANSAALNSDHAVDATNNTNSSQNSKLLSHFGSSSDGYMYRADDSLTNIAAHAHGPGPPQVGGDAYVTHYGQGTLIQEKKKRGRPKKIKGQEVIDPTTGNKILLSNQMQTQHDYNNILNLSSALGGVCNVGEAPKKKRGRPKKLKPPLDNTIHSKQNSLLQQQQQPHPLQQQTSTLMAMHALSGEHTSSPQNQKNMYGTPPPSHRLYSTSVSPMASPVLNCTYPKCTTPISVQATTPIPEQQQHQQHIADTITQPPAPSSPSDHLVSIQTSHLSEAGEPHLGETPPPSSPNISAVDFDPPTAATTNSEMNSEQQQEQEQQRQLIAQQQQHHQEQHRLESSRFASPAHENANEPQTHEHFHQWLSPQHQHQMQSPVSHYSNHHQQQSTSLHYQDHSTHGTQWSQRHQERYENAGSHYLVTSPPHHNTHHNQQHRIQPQQALQTQLSSDVARKSLSGLESLVDQIPTIGEHDTSVMSSATAAAAAAAVESRLQGLQQQQQQQQSSLSHQETSSTPVDVQSEHFGSPTLSNSNNNTQQTSSNIHNSNFSVSNLAASSITSNNSSSNNNNNLIANINSNNNSNDDSYSQSISAAVTPSPSAYHHTNLISAALAAVHVNSPAAAATHHVTHPQMYMDPHMAHIAHVPVNAMYGPAAPPPPPHHHPTHHAHHPHHHHPAYGSAPTAAQHGATTTDYNPYSLASASQSATLHMPSPNYPYGYGHSPSAQTNYTGYASHHHHPHHVTHHLSMFERLKPSDIGGYSGF